MTSFPFHFLPFPSPPEIIPSSIPPFFFRFQSGKSKRKAETDGSRRPGTELAACLPVQITKKGKEEAEAEVRLWVWGGCT